MADPQQFAQVFLELRAILQKYGTALGVSADTSDQYVVKPPDSPELTKMGFFAGLQMRKNYVSLHLAPVYVDPTLLEGASSALKKRMQGKSCFNFAKVDSALFAEMDQLAARSFERFGQQPVNHKV
jgi:hypothetical protein